MKLKKPNKERIALEIAKIVGISVDEIKNDYAKQLNKKYKERIIKYEDSVLREKLATSKGGKKQLGNCNLSKFAKKNPDKHKKNSSKAGKASQLVGGPSKAGKASANSPDNVNNQKWECPDGKVTNLVWRDRYCKKRNLDISKCKRIK